jgi:hypothetical protein
VAKQQHCRFGREPRAGAPASVRSGSRRAGKGMVANARALR